MNVLAVVKNILTKGPVKTYKIHQKRRRDRLKAQSKQEHNRRKSQLKQEVIKGLTELGTPFSEQKDVFDKYMNVLTNGNITEKKYNEEIESIYIKHVYPYVYDQKVKDPLTNKVIFLQPESGLNPDCEDVYNKIKESGKYEVVLCELHKGETSILDYYENVKKFIQEMAVSQAVLVCGSSNVMKHLNIRTETKIIRLWILTDKNVTEKKYNKELRSAYIKAVLPHVYNEEAKKPIENKIVFMERGANLSVSLKYMRDYVKKNTDYEVKTFVLQLREVSDRQYYENAEEYIREAATAKAVFICTANDLMGYITLRPETTYIQLWHGCGVFKKVGLSTMGKSFGKSAKSHKEYPINTNYSYVTIASPELSWIFEESMGIDKDSGIIVPTGISRTDEFFDKEFINRSYEKLYEKIPHAKEKKVILYAPTFRGEVQTCTTPDVLDIEAFAKELGDKYILITKHHPSVKNLPEIPEEYEGTFAFDMTRGKGMNINELMTVADICISDYSSVVFEYALFERPMLFYVYDLEDYIDERGLYYDFNEITPGPLCKTNEEMLDYIKNIEERFDKQEVIDFKNKFMRCCDGHSSERILSLIEK